MASRRSVAPRDQGGFAVRAGADGTYLMGVDIGTLSTKGVLVNLRGQVISAAVVGHLVRHPRPGWAEHDADEDWWGDSRRVIRNLLEQSQVPATQIAGLCVSGLFPVLCPADSTGRPLRPAILYSDTRAMDQVGWVARLSGAKLKGDEAILKYLWLREHEPEIAAQTQMLFSAPGYVVYRLTDVWAVDFQTAYRMGGLLDRDRRGWRQELCAAIEVPLSILPPIYSPLEVIGRVSAVAAQQTGLREGTPVLAGTTDTLATLVGNGVIARGEAMIYYGSTGLLTVCSRDVADVLATPQLMDDETPFILAAYLLNFGEVLEWLIQNWLSHLPADGSAYQFMEEGAAQIPPGSEGVMALPWFCGRVLPEANPHARGAFLGLTPKHTPFHLWHALLEAFGYEIRQSLHSLAARGIIVERAVASGGGARSRLWRQIVSDITGVLQEYSDEDAAARGTAFLAGYGLGLIKSLSAAREQWRQPVDVTYPRPQTRECYVRLFEVYQDLNRYLTGPHQSLVGLVAECDERKGR